MLDFMLPRICKMCMLNEINFERLVFTNYYTGQKWLELENHPYIDIFPINMP